MATRAKSSTRKHSPTVPLRCAKCGGTTVRVSRVRQQLSRSFRRDRGANRKHLHAAVACLNKACGNEWWSAHEKALEVSEQVDARGGEYQVVNEATDAN